MMRLAGIAARPLRRLLGVLPWVVAGLLLGVAVHILSVFTLPRLAPDDARSRLAGVTEVNRLTTLSGRGSVVLPLADPAFETAVCRFDLSAGPLRYEYVHGETHHHLVCQDCGREQEIGDDILDALKTHLLERYAFSAQLNHLAIPGRCAICQHAAGDDTPHAQEREP